MAEWPGGWMSARLTRNPLGIPAPGAVLTPVLAFFLLAILVTALTGCSGRVAAGPPSGASRPGDGGQSTAVVGDRVVQITSSGEARRFRLHVPASYRPIAPAPLVVSLHGAGATATQQEALSGMSAKADQTGFVVAYPEALGSPSAWRVGPAEGNRDVAFVLGVLGYVQRELAIDPARVYVAGISNGGGLASRLGCERADRFAAIAGVSGAYLFADACRPSRAVSVIAFHGTADRIVPYEGKGRGLPAIRDWAGGWAERDGCAAEPAVLPHRQGVLGEAWSGCRDGAEVVLYTLDGAGHGWPRGATTRSGEIDATDVIWEFFAAHPMRGAR